VPQGGEPACIRESGPWFPRYAPKDAQKPCIYCGNSACVTKDKCKTDPDGKPCKPVTVDKNVTRAALRAAYAAQGK